MSLVLPLFVSYQENYKTKIISLLRITSFVVITASQIKFNGGQKQLSMSERSTFYRLTNEILKKKKLIYADDILH